jgi:hypothetical protein
VLFGLNMRTDRRPGPIIFCRTQDPPPHLCCCALQVHLNMFQYFMFWAAFYVLRGAQSSADKG